MAGIGPPPKPSETRRRRNKVVTEELPATGATSAKPPALPATYKASSPSGGPPVEVEFLPETIEWYETLCSSPEAAGLTPLNFLRLKDIAQLQDRFFRTGSLDVQKELRLQLAAFGATPADLRRTGREIPKAKDEKPSPVVDDPASNVRRLRAVDPTAAAAG